MNSAKGDHAIAQLSSQLSERMDREYGILAKQIGDLAKQVDDLAKQVGDLAKQVNDIAAHHEVLTVRFVANERELAHVSAAYANLRINLLGRNPLVTEIKDD